MIKVLVPKDDLFWGYRAECKALYESVQDKIGDDNSFQFIEKNTLFYMFVDEDGLIGGIYYFIDKGGEYDGKLFLNGFANRKMHQKCLECLKLSLNWFCGDIYAEAQNRASALCLLKCGFRRLKENVFVKNNGV